MGHFLTGFGEELLKLAADPRLAQLAPPKPAGNQPAPYQTPRTGTPGTPAPVPSNQVGTGGSSSYLRAMQPQAMQSPTGAGKVDTYRPTQAFQQKAPPPPAMPQPAQATLGGPRGSAQPSGRMGYETGQNFLSRRAGETLSNVMAPMRSNAGVAAKPMGTAPDPQQRQNAVDAATQAKRFDPNAIGGRMGRMM